MKYPWMRRLEVKLSNDRNASVTFGKNKDSLAISVRIKKYLSPLKDEAIVRLKNLSYAQVLQIVSGKYYNVEIFCGYENTGINKVFSGSVLYVSDDLGDLKTNEVIILCSSKLVARFGQAKLSMSLNSGINLYSAASFLLRRAGVKNMHIDDSLTVETIRQNGIVVRESSAQTYLDDLSKMNEEVCVNVDDALDTVVSITKASDFKSQRTIRVDNRAIILTGGYPRLTNVGLTLTVLPLMNFSCGDVVKADNSIINISVTSRQEVQSTNGIFLAKDGLYKIWNVEYVLENRSDSFSAELTCKSKSLIEGDDFDEK